MIPVRNIYYMLAYAFSVLIEGRYRDLSTEHFDNVGELCAAVLERGITSQIKRGLYRDYMPRTETISSVRGKIEVTESVKSQVFYRRQLVCSFDEFSIDTPMNRIIKATVNLLLRSDMSKARKKSLKNLMLYFAEVKSVDLRHADWNLRYDRNNQTYRMLIAVCWLIYRGLIQTQSDGTVRMMDFLDEQRMSHLYEKFLLEYFRREHPELSVSASYIPWALDDGFDNDLPIMKSDVTLSKEGRVLVLDAKYYAQTMQKNFNKRTLHSGNLYQIFTYVKNKEAELARAGADRNVSGMLLYAKTDEHQQPNGVYRMSGNQISVKTLDLNVPFDGIRAQLDAIVDSHFTAQPLALTSCGEPEVPPAR